MYVVTDNWDHEGSTTLGVARTVDGAKRIAEKHNVQPHSYGPPTLTWEGLYATIKPTLAWYEIKPFELAD